MRCRWSKSAANNRSTSAGLISVTDPMRMTVRASRRTLRYAPLARVLGSRSGSISSRAVARRIVPFRCVSPWSSTYPTGNVKLISVCMHLSLDEVDVLGVHPHRLGQERVRVRVYSRGRVAQDRGLVERPGLEDGAVEVQVVDLAVLLGVGVRPALFVGVLEPLEQHALVVDRAFDPPVAGKWILSPSRGGLEVPVLVPRVVGDIVE